MGITIPSFRIASAMEQNEWKEFRKCLDVRQEAIDRMFSIAHLHNSPCSYSAHPIRIQPIFVSIIFHLYKQLIRTLLQKSVTVETLLWLDVSMKKDLKKLLVSFYF
jgi:hypothetical protein